MATITIKGKEIAYENVFAIVRTWTNMNLKV